MNTQTRTQHKNNTPTIAVVVNSLTGGGAERIALISLTELKRKRHQVLLICLEREKGYQVPPGIPVVFLTNFENLKNPIFKVVWVFVSAYRLYRLILKFRISFIQSHLVRSNFINAAAKVFGAGHKIQLVSHLPINFSNSPFPIRVLKTTLYSWFYRQADEVISISQLMKREIEKTLQLERYGVKHRVVHNPHNLMTIRKAAGEIPEKFKFSSDKRYLIVAGRLVKHKRVDVTIKALSVIRKDFPSIELIVLGEGEELAHLKEITQQNGLTPFVHFLGRAANPHAYIARAEALILSSELEGLPNILVEALACGTPVVSSDCISGPREILSPSTSFSLQITSEVEYAPYGILFPVGRTDLLAKGVINLLSDQQLRETYVQKGKIYVEKFDKKKITGEQIRNFFPAIEQKKVPVQFAI